MSDRDASNRFREMGLTAYRTTVLAVATVIAVGMFIGIAFLTYRGVMTEGPLILYTGVILGYILRTVQDLT